MPSGGMPKPISHYTAFNKLKIGNKHRVFIKCLRTRSLSSSLGVKFLASTGSLMDAA